MTNEDIADTLKFTAKLMELHGENAFKVGSYNNASFKLDKYEKELSSLSQQEIESIQGVGKSIATKIHELIASGQLAELNQLVEKTPTGVIEILSIKGIGPKKARMLWLEANIESTGELYYACNENRLVDIKGFGEKTQQQIKQAIEFLLASKNKFHYATAEFSANELINLIKAKHPESQVSFCGALRRKCEIIEKIEIHLSPNPSPLERGTDFIVPLAGKTVSGIPYEIFICERKNFYHQLFLLTGSVEHIAKINTIGLEECLSEEEIYAKNNLPYIEPELRETSPLPITIGTLPKSLIELKDIKGIFHVHTKYSDGKHSLEEMALHCKKLGYEYLGISDHSQTAVYAKGLKPERIFEQHAEIDSLNKTLAPFKIFKGIESDILGDGSLDYEEEILKQFDFVIASVHQNLKMSEEKATARLLKAIENPYTTILGHMTGRLLLSREGYPLDTKKIIDACAANNVVIELNSHPYRLDIDWRWIPYALEKGVMISINPDAHSKEGYRDMYYGVCVARKGVLTAEMTFNSKSIDEITELLSRKKLKQKP
jgi:DNA polymerase (family 10)